MPKDQMSTSISHPTVSATTAIDGLERSTMRKVMLRIVPILFLSYFIAYLDRINIGFAALGMNHDLGLSSVDYGWAAGLFFLTYVVFEIPSNLVLERVGARIWIARIMISWGAVTACTAFVVGPWSLYGARMLLGLAEAGFFPGALLYLTYWCPAGYRAKVISLFSISVPLAGFFGSAISGALLGLDGWLGLRGWQWLFVLEGLPTVGLGVFVLVWLPNKPAHAKWLTAAERDWLQAKLAAEAQLHGASGHQSVWRTIVNPSVLLLGLVSACSLATGYGIAFWQPQMIKAFGLSDLQTGFVTAVPFGIAAVGMVLWSLHSDKHMERVWHTTLSLLTAALGLALAATATSLPLAVLGLSLSLLGGYGVKGPFWALVSDWTNPKTAAAALGTINSIANISGFVAPMVIGMVKQSTGSIALGLAPMCAMSVFGAAIVWLMNLGRRRTAKSAQTRRQAMSTLSSAADRAASP
jgi:ACS family tartrate transporter-like MFS transporter